VVQVDRDALVRADGVTDLGVLLVDSDGVGSLDV
jgi:hypothetical protein